MTTTRIGALLILCAASATAQLHTDEIRGFQFKPPREYVTVALQPDEFMYVAKYQSESPDYGGEQGYTSFHRRLDLIYFPIPSSEEEREQWDPGEAVWNFLDANIGYTEIEDEDDVRIGHGRNRVEATERVLDPPGKPVKAVCTIIPQDDGVYAFIGQALRERFDKAEREFSRAIKSFERIEKADRSERQAELAQMSDQERFLARQIDKLPDDWGHLRTDRYLFLYNAEEDFVEESADRIESMRDEYEELFPPREPIEEVSIVRVVNSAAEYQAYGGSARANGHWSSYHKELVLFDRRPYNALDATLETLNHEAFHQYIYYWAGELAPHSWYNEGHGEYFGGARLTRTHRVKEYARRVYTNRMPPLQEALRITSQGGTMAEGGLIPLKLLTRYSQQEYYAGDVVQRAYSQGWAFVHMLRESRRLEDEWEEILPNYLDNLLQARHEVAQATAERAAEKWKRDQAKLERAGKKPEDDEERPSSDPLDYYGRLDVGEVQDLAWTMTFGDWTDEDWAELDEEFAKYIEKKL